ncbi:unnamed protein product [Microthlaspi erraticum]|uniref:Reverse transcriptase zinc-binding domain-containing protein n=1 Tax=Microthlaspi erraticum TaxID=1685480 RepID=A0A6D2IQQ3_9BRAS|nr:unnamed protein product [Microthlaspi erraticum]
MWQSTSCCLAVKQALVSRHCGTDPSCSRCGAEKESVNHLFFECPAAVQVWTLSDIPSAPGIFPCDALYNNLDYLLWRAKDNNVPEKKLAIFPWILWFIWKARNEKVFSNKDIQPDASLQSAVAESESWALAQLIDSSMDESDPTRTTSTRIDQTPTLPRCQVDASWVSGNHVYGGGFVLDIYSG